MITQEEIDIATKVGSYYASRWRQVEKEDLISHLILWCAERDGVQLQRWRDEGSLSGKLYKSLKREANTYCQHETSKKVNQDLYANNSYTMDIVKRTLPLMFDEHTVEDPINSTALMIIADVRSALYGCSKEDIQIITLRYELEYSHDDIAEELGVSVDTASQRLHRALERLLNRLSGVALFDWSDVGVGGSDD